MALRNLTFYENYELQGTVSRLGITLTNPNPLPNTYFHVVHKPGRGESCVAVRNITRGTRILEEAEIFSLGNVANANAPANRLRIDVAVQTLAPLDLQEFNRLSHTGAATNSNRFKNNAFQLPNNGQRQDGNFLRASRFNHSCVPNAYFTFNQHLGQGRLTIHVIQDIALHEEIVINYFSSDSYKPRVTRQARLFNTYGFNCDCPACDAHAPSADESEYNRKFFRDFGNVQIRNHVPNLARRHEEFSNLEKWIELLKEENIVYPQQAETLDLLAQCCIREMTQAGAVVMGRGKARDCGLQAARAKLELDVLCNGHDSIQVRNTLDLIGKLG